MLELMEAVPARRPELLLNPLDDSGRCVVKNVRTGAYFELGAEESFLLSQLDGVQTPEFVCIAFQARFGQELTREEFFGFLEEVQELGFVQADESATDPANDFETAREDDLLRALHEWPVPGAPPEPYKAPEKPAKSKPKSSQNILFFRYSLFDPDRLFNWLGPRLWFVWTRPFLLTTSGVILAAIALVWFGRQELVSQLPQSFAWQTLALTAVVMVTVTMCHEFAWK